MKVRVPLAGAQEINQRWSMDFVADRLVDGRMFRMLTIVDQFSRESLSTQPRFSYPGKEVVASLEQIASQRGYPEAITIDNGTEPERSGDRLSAGQPEGRAKRVNLAAKRWKHGPTRKE